MFPPLSASLALALGAGVAVPATFGSATSPALAATAARKVPVARVTSLDGFPTSRRIVLNSLSRSAGLRAHTTAKVRVTNTGRSALSVRASAVVTARATSVYGPDKTPAPASFQVTGQPLHALAPGKHVDLTVRYVARAVDQTAYRPDRGTLTITTNDPKHKVVRLALAGLREYTGGFHEPSRNDLASAFGWRTQELAPRVQYRFRPVKKGSARVRDVAAFGAIHSTLDLRYRTTGTATRRVLTRGVLTSSSVRPLTPAGAVSAGTVPGSAVFSLLARISVAGETHTRDAVTLAPAARQFWRVRVFRDAKSKVVPHRYLLLLDEPVPGGSGNGDFQDEVLLLTGVDLTK